MALRKIIIIFLYLPFLISNAILRIFGLNRDLVRIILMHDIPVGKHEIFKSQIEYISKKWNFITTKELEEHYSGKKKLKGRNVLLTFDDGFHSNKVIAEKILDPLGVKALFFVVGNFIKQETQEDQQNFIKDSLYPDWRGHDLPDNFDEMKSMDIEDLKILLNNGHSLGFHTTNHANLATLSTRQGLKKEIIDGAIELEKELDLKIKHFSFGFGNVEFFSKDALKVAHDHFEFIHTGMRGNNQINTPIWALRRDTISLDDSHLEIASFLEGSADRRYSSAFKKYESWLKDAI